MSSFKSHNGGVAGGKKSRATVKPILRKLTQSEKTSLDLDRPIAEQDGIYDYVSTRSSHDMITGRRGYTHNRSTSQVSTGSGKSFIHPAQQQPYNNRPYTPPVASTYSLEEIDDEIHNYQRPEDKDRFRQHHATLTSTSNLSIRAPSINASGQSASPVGSHPLRIQTRNNSSSRLALHAYASHTSLHNLTEVASPADTMSPSSAIRSSIDKGFRIRSRSEVDTRPRTETIQEARRKFQEKEKAKDEKAAQEHIKAMEKNKIKEAKQIERHHRHSSASERTRSKRSRSDLTYHEKPEDLVGHGYSSTSYQDAALPDEDTYATTPRSNTAKLKTHSAWTKFVMWLRTRLLRMNKK